jgi:hypothetical protein
VIAIVPERRERVRLIHEPIGPEHAGGVEALLLEPRAYTMLRRGWC